MIYDVEVVPTQYPFDNDKAPGVGLYIKLPSNLDSAPNQITIQLRLLGVNDASGVVLEQLLAKPMGGCTDNPNNNNSYVIPIVNGCHQVVKLTNTQQAKLQELTALGLLEVRLVASGLQGATSYVHQGLPF